MSYTTPTPSPSSYRTKLSAFLAIAFIAIASPALLKAQFIGGSFIKGCNLAWENGNYNTWLGVDPANPSWGVTYNSANLNSYMQNMHNMGITVLRVWVNEADMGDTVNGSDFVTGVTAAWNTNFADMMRLAGNNGIQLYVTINNGRADWLENTSQAASYLNNALLPLIRQYKGDSRIFAIDVMNEIDGTVQGSLGNYTTTGATWAQAQSYIKTFASAIHGADSSRKVSCSTGWHAWNNLSEFRGLGLDFYDFHSYTDNPSFPSASSLGMDRPIYIGECGQGTQSWNDSIQNSTELSALNSALSQGYAGVGIWDYAYAGSTEIFSMINTNGSNRPVCATIQNWHATSGGGGGGGGGGSVSNGTYKIINRNSGMALDVVGAGTGNGTLVDQWPYGGNSNQKWTVTGLGSGQFEIVGVGSGKSLDVSGAKSANGTAIDVYAYSGNSNQKWILTATTNGYFIISPVLATGSCVDVPGNSTSQGTDLDLWNINNGNNQQWIFQAP